MTVLVLARAWYAVVGLGSLVMTGGHVTAVITGSRLDPVMALVGMAVGVLSVLAAAWVSSVNARRAAISRAGIIAGALPFVVLVWIAITTAQDAIALAVVPAIIALAAAAILARTRASARIA